MRLSHAEAQALVSARLDGPLDPVAERELNAHLATCDSCRAFNGSATQLARGLQSLPYLPASPAVTRAVLDRVSVPRSGWSRFMGSMPENAMPVATAIAAAVIVVFVGAFALFQNLGDDDPETLPALTQESQNVAKQPDGTEEPATNAVATETGFEPESTSEPGTGEKTEEPVLTEESLPVETGSAGTGTESASTEEQTGATEVSGTTEEPGVDEGNGESTTEPSNTLALQGSTETPENAQVTEEPQAPTEEQVTEETSEPTEEPATDAVETPAGEETEEALIGPSGRSISVTETSEPTEEPTAEPTATEEQIATEEPTTTVEPSPTATAEPTATTEPTSTATLEPTATTEPSPTATPEPTATVEPSPTETLEPTATLEPTPTATLEPTATEEPSPTATLEPTATATLEPTATEEPSPTPTEEQTPTLVPIVGRDDTPESEVPTQEQTTEETEGTGPESSEDASPEDGETPLIEPSGNTDGTTEDGDGSADTTDGADDGEEPVESGDGTEGDDGDQVIQPSDGSDSADDADDSSDDGSVEDADDGSANDGGSDGEPSGGDETQEGTGSASISLGSAPVYSGLGDVEGNPEQRLGLSADGTLIFSVNPGRVSLENNGITVTGLDSAGGQAVHACIGDDCVDISSASRGEGSYTDTPIGWLNGEVIYERLNGDEFPVEYRAVSIDGNTLEPGQDRLIGGGDSTADWETLIRPYPVNDGLLVPTQTAWLLVTPDSVSAIDGNPYGEMTQIRFTPATGIVSYVAGGDLILASIQAPGTAIATLPFNGGDYDFSPNGDQVAILTDEEMQILDLNGNLITTIPNAEGVNVGSLTWLNQGIVYVDFTNNVIRVVQP